jgi:uncharacterized protein (TIGR03437 family)
MKRTLISLFPSMGAFGTSRHSHREWILNMFSPILDAFSAIGRISKDTAMGGTRLGIVALSSCLFTAAHANVLLNPGFECPTISNGDIFGATDWDVFGGDTFTTAVLPHSGNNAFKAFGDASGAFQEFPASPGQTWKGSVWAVNPSFDALTGGEIAAINIEWRDVFGELISYETTVLLNSRSSTGSQSSDYVFGEVTGTAPVGTADARFVLIVGAFAGVGGGAAYFDDASFEQVPEPSSFGLVGLALLGFGACLRPLADGIAAKFRRGRPLNTRRAQNIVRFTLIAVLAGVVASAQTTSGWKLVWSDEFNGPASTPPDPTKWNYDLGGGGWGNAEIETYTKDPSNVFQDGKGNLVIRVIRDGSGNYTSARLLTGGPTADTHTTDLSWQYGWIEARIKLPFGKGIWPAFWMLGENIGSVGWPASGEIDILENFGTFNNNASVNNATANGPGYTGAIGKAYTLPYGQNVADDYHVYAIAWSQDSIEWSLDGVAYYKVTPASIPVGRQWVFNNPFFILLNLAIAGPNTVATTTDGTEVPLGTPDPNAPFPAQDMLVDYVRVYQANRITIETPSITPGRVMNAASYLGAIAPGSLAVVYGNNLADGTYLISPPAGNSFPTSVAGVTISLNGINAPLIYVSSTQINFQVPWEIIPGVEVNVKVTRNGVDSNVEPITMAATSPSVFLSEYQNGIAWVTGDGCPNTECAVQAGTEYTFWANGFGPKNALQQDGVPAAYTGSVTPLEVPGSTASCQLTIDGQVARIDYCGAAPGEIIDQLNFEYPSGVATGRPYVDATLTINAVIGRFRVPAPPVSKSNPVSRPVAGTDDPERNGSACCMGPLGPSPHLMDGVLRANGPSGDLVADIFHRGPARAVLDALSRPTHNAFASCAPRMRSGSSAIPPRLLLCGTRAAFCRFAGD